MSKLPVPAKAKPITAPTETPEPASETNQPLPGTEASETDTSVDLEFLKQIDTGEEAARDEAETASGQGGEVKPVQMSKDAFFSLFRTAFYTPNLMLGLARVEPFPLDSLPIKDHELVEARAASDAIYDLAEKTPALSWMLTPKGEWWQAMTVIGGFAISKASAIVLELRARNAKPVNPEPQSQPDQEAKPEPEKPSETPKPEPEYAKVINATVSS